MAYDRLDLAADDRHIDADGADLTRVVVRVTDRYDWTRPRGLGGASGTVELHLEGPGEIIGESRFSLDDGGPLRAVWLRGLEGQRGQLRLLASHAHYGKTDLSVKRIEARRRERSAGRRATRSSRRFLYIILVDDNGLFRHFRLQERSHPRLRPTAPLCPGPLRLT